MKSFLILLVTVTVLIGICYLALNYYALFKIVMFLLIGYIAFFLVWVEIIGYKIYLDFIRMLRTEFNGRVAKNNFSEKQVFFDFGNREFEFFYQLVWFPYSYGGYLGASNYRMNYLKLKTNSDFSLFFWQKIGDTLIGKSSDRIIASIMAHGCQELNIPLPSLLQNYKVYSNNETKAGYFISQEEVLHVLPRYMNSRETGQQSLARLYIEQGVVILQGFIPRNDSISLKDYLSDMKLFAYKLNS